MSQALAPLRQRDRGHDPDRVALDLAVMLADGGEAIADLAVLRNQSELFGPVASDATAWRVLDGIDTAALDRIRAARARVRELAWAQAAETGQLTSSMVGGFTIPGFVFDIDATIVVCHSDKESAAKTWKKSFAHPLLCFLDATGEALAGLLRGPAASGDRIRCGKDSGLGRFPSRQFAINAAWLELALIGIDLLAFTRTLLLDGEHALAEPKKLRYRLLHVAARLVRTARRTILRIARHWPWANQLATAYARLAALPQPIG